MLAWLISAAKRWPQACLECVKHTVPQQMLRGSGFRGHPKGCAGPGGGWKRDETHARRCFFTEHLRRIASCSERTTLRRGTIPKQTGKDTAALPVTASQIAADTSGRQSPLRQVGSTASRFADSMAAAA